VYDSAALFGGSVVPLAITGGTGEYREARGDGTAEKLLPSLAARLKQVRSRGYESMASLQTRGVTNLSVPILGPVGTVLAAYTCPYTERLDNAASPDREAALAMLIEGGNEISTRGADTTFA